MVFDRQWSSIVSSNVFSEEVSMALSSGDEFKIKGMYFSGSYSNGSDAPYQNSHWMRQEWFEITPLLLPSAYRDRPDCLKKAVLTFGDGKVYTVFDVKGERSGSLMLQLLKKDNRYDTDES